MTPGSSVVRGVTVAAMVILGNTNHLPPSTISKKLITSTSLCSSFLGSVFNAMCHLEAKNFPQGPNFHKSKIFLDILSCLVITTVYLLHEVFQKFSKKQGFLLNYLAKGLNRGI